jgi:hypothetical protein
MPTYWSESTIRGKDRDFGRGIEIYAYVGFLELYVWNPLVVMKAKQDTCICWLSLQKFQWKKALPHDGKLVGGTS